jgi:hypothetical protein
LQPITGSFRVDIGEPVVLDVNITAISEIGKTSYVASGDALEVHAYIEDFTPVTAEANFTNIMPELVSVETVECTEFESTTEELTDYVIGLREDRNKRVWDCRWDIGPIVEVSAEDAEAIETSIGFIFTDIVGNSAEHEEDIKIFGKENVTGDYWKTVWVGQSPSEGIDRFTWTISQPVSYQHVKIVNIGVPARIVAFDFDPTTCEGDIDYLFYAETGKAGVTYMHFDPNTGDGIDDMFLVEMNPVNVPPATDVGEDGNEYVVEQLTYTCSAWITSIVNEQRVSLPEQENITLYVNVYGNPLGQNIGNVKDEVDRHAHPAEGNLEFHHI